MVCVLTVNEKLGKINKLMDRGLAIAMSKTYFVKDVTCELHLIGMIVYKKYIKFRAGNSRI